MITLLIESNSRPPIRNPQHWRNESCREGPNCIPVVRQRDVVLALRSCADSSPLISPVLPGSGNCRLMAAGPEPSKQSRAVPLPSRRRWTISSQDDAALRAVGPGRIFVLLLPDCEIQTLRRCCLMNRNLNHSSLLSLKARCSGSNDMFREH